MLKIYTLRFSGIWCEKFHVYFSILTLLEDIYIAVETETVLDDHEHTTSHKMKMKMKKKLPDIAVEWWQVYRICALERSEFSNNKNIYFYFLLNIYICIKHLHECLR